MCQASVPATALAKGPGPASGPRGDLPRSGVVGSTPPAQGGPQIFGVNAAGAPWVTEDGDIRVDLHWTITTKTQDA